MSVNHDKLRQRAFEIWEAEGRPQGRDVEHWLRAEAELTAVSSAVSAKTAKAAGAKSNAKSNGGKPTRRAPRAAAKV